MIFLGVLSMLLYHIFVFLFIHKIIPVTWEEIGPYTLIGLFAALLPIAAGSILYLGINKSIVNNKLINYKISSAFFLFLFFLILNFIIFFLVRVYKPPVWHVLAYLGLSFLIIFILSKFSVYLVFVAGLLSIILTPLVRSKLSAYASNYFISVLIGNVQFSIYWPLFPYFSLVAFGFLISYVYLKFNKKKYFRTSLIRITIFLLIVFILFYVFIYTPPNMEKGGIKVPPLDHIFFLLFVFFLVLSSIELFLNKIRIKKYGLINTYSRGILWIFVLTTIAGFNLLIILKNFLPMLPIIIILGLFMLTFAWAIGALCIKLNEKKFNIIFKKV